MPEREKICGKVWENGCVSKMCSSIIVDIDGLLCELVQSGNFFCMIMYVKLLHFVVGF